MHIFHVSVNATRECQGDGTWGPITYYGDCLCNSTEACLAYSSNITDMESTPALEISIIIYLIGNIDIPIIIALKLSGPCLCLCQSGNEHVFICVVKYQSVKGLIFKHGILYNVLAYFLTDIGF